METQDQLAEATKRVNIKIGFYIHLTVYVIVNAVLVVINLLTTPDHIWFPWPMAGWGIGIVAHGLTVLGMSKGRSLRERMIERELKRTLKSQ